MPFQERMNLGQLIEALDRKDPDFRLVFDFVNFKPSGHVGSYRGYYEQFAIGYSDEWKPNDEMTVGKLLKILKESVGQTFTGYKGGKYVMWDDTPVWVANSGEVGSTVITDVQDTKYDRIRLVTAQIDD